jgi:hypothetical protein
LGEKHQVQLFIAGLAEDIQYDVQILEPSDLEKAMSLARAYEKKNNRTGVSSQRGTRRVTPMNRVVPSINPGAKTGNMIANPTVQDGTPTRTFRKLTPAEMAERRRQGLFF